MKFLFHLLSCLLLAASCHATAAARTALVIGNSRYEEKVGALKNTVNDAKAMAAGLKRLGFAVIEKHNVTRDDLLKAVMEFRTTLAGAEVGLFYYAGHGISIGGSNYLIPLKSGYSPDGADDITLRLLAETRLFNIEQAVADMSAAGAKCNLIILDACRTTAVARTGRTRSAETGGGLAEMKPPAGSLIAFATDAGQTALDGDGTYGLYTGELLRHLMTPGLTIEQVFKRTRAAVLEKSEGGQVPAEYSRLLGDDIYLAGLAPAAAPAPATPSADTVAAAPAMTRDVASSATPPSAKRILELARAGQAEACADALLETARLKGPGSYAVEPLTLLLDQARDRLKEETLTGPALENITVLCTQVLRALPSCLSPGDALFAPLTAKAHNRRGDALARAGRTEEALSDFDLALALTPDDSYILYNRGRAYATLDRKEEAKKDLQAASDPKYNQPGARKLAIKALAELD